MPTKAQVGIGNTDPDASSLLNIRFTSKGLLTPRMITAQRTAIATPRRFYYYDSLTLTWIRLSGDKI